MFRLLLATSLVGSMAQCEYSEVTSGIPSAVANKSDVCSAFGSGCSLTGTAVDGLEPCEAAGVDCCPPKTTTTTAKAACTNIKSYDTCNAVCDALFGQSSTSYSSWATCKVSDESCCEGPFVVAQASGSGVAATAVGFAMLAAASAA